jgi:hypothetical protein
MEGFMCADHGKPVKLMISSVTYTPDVRNALAKPLLKLLKGH